MNLLTAFTSLFNTRYHGPLSKIRYSRKTQAPNSSRQLPSRVIVPHGPFDYNSPLHFPLPATTWIKGASANPAHLHARLNSTKTSIFFFLIRSTSVSWSFSANRLVVLLACCVCRLDTHEDLSTGDFVPENGCQKGPM